MAKAARRLKRAVRLVILWVLELLEAVLLEAVFLNIGSFLWVGANGVADNTNNERTQRPTLLDASHNQKTSKRS